MAKRHRSAAQKAATKRMLAARKHRNPSHHAPRKAKRRRAAVRVHRNPARRRSGGGGLGANLFGELMSKEGLMMIAGVALTPTLTELAIGYAMPTATGYTRIGVKAALGLAIGYAVHRFVSKKAGLMVALVSAGTGVAEAIKQYQAPTATVKGYMSGYQMADTLQDSYSNQENHLGNPYELNDGGMGYMSPDPGTVQF